MTESKPMTVIRPKKFIPRWEPIVLYQATTINFALGNGTQFKMRYLIMDGKNSILKLFVGIPKAGAYVFSTQKPTNPNFVARKLNLFEGDAAIIADWINFQIGKYNSRELLKEYGSYEEQYLDD